MDDKDWTADNQEEQTCQGSTHQSWAVHDGPAIQGQKRQIHWKTYEDIVSNKHNMMKNYTNAETGHNKWIHTVPDIETTNPFVKVSSLPDNSPETDNDYTIDNSKNSPITTEQRENTDTKQPPEKYRQHPSHEAKEKYDDTIKAW